MKRKSTLFFYYNICIIIDIMITNKHKKEEGKCISPSSCDIYKLFKASIVLSYFS